MAHIVLIEDNPQTARMATRLLRDRSHDVQSFQTGEEGLLALFSSSPDLILMDLGLPDIDGQTVIALIRQQPTLAGTPVIAFTAWSPDVARNMAKAYGCDGVIAKPIDTRMFAQQVEAFLHSSPVEDSTAKAE
ncbi:MAG TPA: response regulator [Aggregatilineales bacterium]|nr:response regulator [Aggregatilineales bacterium]